ncbi:MAG: hypothetical protein AABX34_04740 [Nanoarchaeota archaeon]
MTMDNAQYVGQLVIAELRDLTRGDYNKFFAMIRSGSLTGKDCYVAYRGDPEPLAGKEAIVRLGKPRERYRYSSPKAANAHFITSIKPDGFDNANSDEAILYGIFEQRMLKASIAPRMEELLEFFDAGSIASVLHYSRGNGLIVPYHIVWRNEPEMMWGGWYKVRSPGDALRRHLRRRLNPIDVGVVTMEEDTRLETAVLAEFDKVINSQEFRIKMSLKMEPQQ